MLILVSFQTVQLILDLYFLLQVIPPLLEGLSASSLDVLNKEMTYNLLLVLSGILMDENGKILLHRNNYMILCFCWMVDLFS